MITYKIKPKLIKRLFRKPKLIFELIEVEDVREFIDHSYGNGGGDFIDMEEETVIFKSEDLEEVKNIKENLENIN